MKNTRITIIGGGNLGAAIARGLLESGDFIASNIAITRRRTELLQDLAAAGIQVTKDNNEAVRNADLVILCVQPRQAKQILEDISPDLRAGKHIIVSVITGLVLQEIKRSVPDGIPVFRAMPNTAVAIRESMTCIAPRNGHPEQEALVKMVFDQVGSSLFIEEELMEAATVLGACGIAYAMRYIRAASQGGIEIGFDAAEAQMIAAQTVKGAAALLLTEGRHPESEIDKVTTPQGCTIAGLNEMEHQGFSSALIKGISTSYRKIGKIRDDQV